MYLSQYTRNALIGTYHRTLSAQSLDNIFMVSFTQTNQTDVLNAPDLPSVVSGMRSICAIASTLLGGAASADGEVPTSSSSAVPTPTALSTSGSAKVLLPRAQSLKLFVVLCFLSSAVIL